VEFSLSLINTALAQQFLTHMKTAFSAGLLCAVPYILYALLAFVTPALYDHEKRYVSALVVCGYVMFMGGVLLGYFLVFPFTFRFLSTYQVSADVANMITLDSYMSAFMGMVFMLGLIFEMPILCWMLAKLRLLNAEFMRKYRRHAVVLILIIAAIITPTADVFTLSLVSLPMLFLYELSIGVVSVVNKKSEE
jgi:sec-independent protein translocase protein TatC